MKRLKLDSLSVDELVERFAVICVAQDQALFDDAYAKFNRLYKEMDAVEKEIRARGVDARLALLKLYTHPNMQVRVQVAKCTLGVAPQAARQLLEAIAGSAWYPQAGDAGMSLDNLDAGIFKPD